MTDPDEVTAVLVQRLAARGLEAPLRQLCLARFVLLEDVLGSAITAKVVGVRRECFQLLRDPPYAFSFQEIGFLMGKAHSTVERCIETPEQRERRLERWRQLTAKRSAVRAAKRATGDQTRKRPQAKRARP